MAAFKDSRFPPIRKDELASLSVRVSLLTDYETCQDTRDWTLGEHGVEICLNLPNNWKQMYKEHKKGKNTGQCGCIPRKRHCKGSTKDSEKKNTEGYKASD